MTQNSPHQSPAEDPKHLRLTLRTLLAYLDDVLEPQQAREIGVKLAETEYASQLVDRIQNVLRRRRVAAPGLEGPGAGLDPNTVAEYLDNTLFPKGVQDVERVCLESDVHLAEVAACHQILTLILGDPVHVSATSRERLYALIPAARAAGQAPAEKSSAAAGIVSPAKRQPAAAQPAAPAMRNANPSAKAAAASGAVASSAVASSAVAVAATGSSNGDGAAQAVPARRGRFSESFPDYLKGKPWWKRALIPGLVVLVFVGWLGLIVYDPSFLGNEPKETKDVDLVAQQTEAGPVTPAVPPASSEEAPAVAATDTTNNAATTPPAPAIQIDEPPPPDAGQANPVVQGTVVEEPPAKLTPPPANGQSDTTAKPPETVVAVTPKEPPLPLKETDPPLDSANDPRVVYTTKQANAVSKGVLLHFDPDEKKWGVLPQWTSVMLGKQLVCPEPLDAVFSVDKSGCEVTFVGGVLASFERAKPPAAFGLKLSQGQVIFARSEDEEAAKNCTASVLVGDDTFLLELMEPQTRCGLEIIPRSPNQPEKSLGPEWYVGQFWVDAGQVRITGSIGPARILTAKQSLDLTPVPKTPEDQQPAAKMAEPYEITPDWLRPEGRYFSPTTTRYVRQLYNAFHEQTDLEIDVTFILLPLVKDSQTEPQVAMMAARSLALTSSISALGDVLPSANLPQEVREAAIDGARKWLTLNPKQGDLLRTELRRNVNQKTADAIYRLLWGYQKSDLEDRFQAHVLVDWLEDDNPTVRTLAFMHLNELTKQTKSYRPLDSANQRKTAVKRWRDDVEQGKLLNLN